MQDYSFNEYFDRFPLAMAYVPMQKFTNLYGAAEGFRRGTLFKELDLPFKGGKSK